MNNTSCIPHEKTNAIDFCILPIDELQAKIKTLEGTVTANNGTIQDARILKPETNTTVEHATEMTAIEANRQRISKLESIENDSKILYENMEFRLNYLEGIYFTISV